MTDPTVCAIMLTRDRPAMAKRAVESFRRQAYANKRLSILDTGRQRLYLSSEAIQLEPQITYCYGGEWPGKTIGELRNVANGSTDYDIVCHWDDDDWSHPNRIAEQVALLTSSGADAVGYSDLLFWRFVDCRCPSGTCSPRDSGHWKRMLDSCHDPRCPRSSDGTGDEAWLYSRPTRLNVPGTSLCYWRKTWERKPFPHLPEVGNPTSQGEDIVWQAGLKVVAVSSILSFPKGENVIASSRKPRMIASVHSGNTMAAGYSHMGHVEEFARTPEWDSYCERTMRL